MMVCGIKPEIIIILYNYVRRPFMFKKEIEKHLTDLKSGSKELIQSWDNGFIRRRIQLVCISSRKKSI